MKRVFTLGLALGLFIAAGAQPVGMRPRRPAPVRVIVTPPPPGFAADPRLRAEISRINSKYDRKIAQVRRNLFMRQVVKAERIRSLEIKRRKELDKAFRKFGRNNRAYPNRRY